MLQICFQDTLKKLFGITSRTSRNGSLETMGDVKNVTMTFFTKFLDSKKNQVKQETIT